MTTPPRIVPVEGDDELYRRIVSFHLYDDGTVNPAAFRLRGKPDPSLSVEHAKLTTARECADRPGRPGFGVAALKASVPLALGLKVQHAPEPGNYAHALIEGNDNKANTHRLALASRVIIPPASRTESPSR